MKKYILISGFAILGLTVSSCTGDKGAAEENATTGEGTEAIVTGDESGTSTDQQPLNFDEQSMSGEAVQVQAPGTGASGTSTAGARLNPAHGEPGHVCEVAVGAPLPADGSAPAPAPAKSAAPQNIQIQNSGQPSITQPAPTSSPAPTSIMNTSVPTQAPASAGATAPGMNPPHGEPGHDCAIPVGQPLKK